MKFKILAILGFCISFSAHATKDKDQLLRTIKKQREMKDLYEKFEQMTIEGNTERIQTELVPLIITLDPVVGGRRLLLRSRDIIEATPTDLN